MDVIRELDALRRAALVDEDGDALTPTFLPACDETRLAAIERELGAPLPADLRELLRHTSGIEGLLAEITFAGSDGFGMDDAFPKCVPIAGDGFGNFWVVDVVAAPEPRAQVFFACHDPPVILFQCDGMAAFLAELVRMHTPPHRSLLGDAREERVFAVWRENPGTIPHAAALQSADACVREFAGDLDGRFVLCDLRTAQPGMGFSWGRYGPGTEVRRHGDDRLFAVAAPPPRPGLLARWFGRRPPRRDDR